MDAADTKTLIERLQEEWIEVADASVYRELELEKQLWMLSALRTLGQNNEQTTDVVQRSAANSSKILSLYENQGKNLPLVTDLS